MSSSTKSLVFDRSVSRRLHTVSTETAMPYSKLLILRTAGFLQRQSSTGELLPQISEKMLQQLMDKYDHVVVLRQRNTRVKSVELEIPPHAKMTVIDVDIGDVASSMWKVVQILKHEFQVTFNLPQQLRRISWQNIGSFITDERVRTAGTNDHASVGIELDKDLSFQDMANLRSKKSWI